MNSLTFQASSTQGLHEMQSGEVLRLQAWPGAFGADVVDFHRHTRDGCESGGIAENLAATLQHASWQHPCQRVECT